jgi:hypothetical protein
MSPAPFLTLRDEHDARSAAVLLAEWRVVLQSRSRAYL